MTPAQTRRAATATESAQAEPGLGRQPERRSGRGGDEPEQQQRADRLGRLARVDPEQHEERRAEQPDRHAAGRRRVRARSSRRGAGATIAASPAAITTAISRRNLRLAAR